MIKRRNLRTRNIKMLVLDEADEMLNKGTHSIADLWCVHVLVVTLYHLRRLQGADL